MVTAGTKRNQPSLEQTRENVLSELYAAIQEADEAGIYQCCIKPQCTMCYLNGNEWNHGNAGTCACDEFIERGEDPCPQCQRGIEEGICESTIQENKKTINNSSCAALTDL